MVKPSVVVVATKKAESSTTKKQEQKAKRTIVKEKKPKVEDKVNLVSVSYYTSEAQNCVTIQSLVWPLVHLYIPFVNSCHTCHAVHQWFYELCYKEKVSHIVTITFDELLEMDYSPSYQEEKKKETEEEDEDEDKEEEDDFPPETLERHSHAFVINEASIIQLCKKPLPRKPRPETKIVIGHDDDDEDGEGEGEEKKKEDKVDKKQRTPVDSWTTQTIKEIKSVFYVETIKGKVISSGTTTVPFEPYDFQDKFRNHVINTYDWKDPNVTHDLPFLLWHTVGLGKTLTALYAMQQTYPKRVTIVCDNALIKTRWCEEMFKYLPPRFGNTLYQVIGYQEFRRRTQEEPEQFFQDVMIVDEAQEYRTLTPGMMYDLGCFRHCRMLFNLTGTPFINQLEDLFGLNVMMEVVDLQDMKWFRMKQESYHIMKEDDLDEEILTNHASIDDLDQLKRSGVLNSNTTTKKRKTVSHVPFDYINNSVSPEFRQWLLSKYKGRVFYMEPSIPIETSRIDVQIPMTWKQSFHYLMNMQQNMVLSMRAARHFYKQHRGKHYQEDEHKDLIENDPADYQPIKLSSAVHNAYDSMVRSICNCLYEDQKKTKVMDAVKFFWYLRLLEEKWLKRDTDESIFPTVGYSNFLDCGVLGFYRLWKSYIAQQEEENPESPLLKIRLEIIQGHTSEKERIRLISDFNRQKIHVLLISKVGGRGLNLIGCKSITLFEVPMAPGEEEQIIGRICRAGNKSEANKQIRPLLIFRLISVFPTTRPDLEESAYIRNQIHEMSRGHKIPHILDIVYRYVRSVGQTVDQKCVARNDLKTKQFAFLKNVLQEASI